MKICKNDIYLHYSILFESKNLFFIQNHYIMISRIIEHPWGYMSSRRSRFEIYIDVLKEVKSGANKPTQIMYGANLSWKPLKGILKSLLNQGLLTGIEGDPRDKRTKVIYGLTQKGENVIRYYGKAKSLVEIHSPEDLDA